MQALVWLQKHAPGIHMSINFHSAYFMSCCKKLKTEWKKAWQCCFQDYYNIWFLFLKIYWQRNTKSQGQIFLTTLIHQRVNVKEFSLTIQSIIFGLFSLTPSFNVEASEEFETLREGSHILLMIELQLLFHRVIITSSFCQL